MNSLYIYCVINILDIHICLWRLKRVLCQFTLPWGIPLVTEDHSPFNTTRCFLLVYKSLTFSTFWRNSDILWRCVWKIPWRHNFSLEWQCSPHLMIYQLIGLSKLGKYTVKIVRSLSSWCHIIWYCPSEGMFTRRVGLSRRAMWPHVACVSWYNLWD